MENLEQEIKSLCQLLNSWQDENIELAFHIMKGNRGLAKLVKEIYQPLFDFCDKKWSLKNFKALPQAISYGGDFEKGIPFSEPLSQLMSNMPLSVIYYTNQELSVFPWWVCKLSRLEDIYLDNNKIEELPEELFSMERLEVLSVCNNKLKQLSENIGQLVNLIKLQLDFNEIELLPDSIGNLVNLEWLCLEKNKLKLLPKTALQLKSLEWLSIEGTPLGKRHRINHGMYITVDSPKFLKLLE